MLQQCSVSDQNEIKVIEFDQVRPDNPDDMEVMDNEPEYKPFLEDYKYDFFILFLLFVGGSGYLMVIRPSRYLFKRYKKSLHRRRRFYSGLDRRRTLKAGSRL
jgi:hypothetical protein